MPAAVSANRAQVQIRGSLLPQCFEPGFHGIADRGVGNSQVFDLAALSGDQDGGVTHVIGANGVIVDFDGGDGRAGPNTLCHDRFVSLLDTVQNGFTERKLSIAM